MADRPVQPARRGWSGTSARSARSAVDRLDQRERRFTFAAAALALVVGIAIYLSETGNAHFRLSKGELTPQTTLVVGVVAAALLVGAALLGRRAPVGFVAVLTGLAFSNSHFVAALPFLALGVWIFIHSYRIQKEATAQMKAARAEASARGDDDTRSRGPGRERGRQSAGAGRSGAAHPEANKRYTPKRAPLPAPKPSRRERKATGASG